MADVLTIDDLVGLLDRFGMKVGIDLDGAAAEGVSRELVAARLSHALVGVVEAHASRADDAARRAGADASDIAEITLMAFAGANCQREADEWALIEWRATRLAMALSELDFGGPLPRSGQVGSGDVLVRTIREVAGALAAMATAKRVTTDPLRPAGDAAVAGQGLARAMDVLEQAAAAAAGHRAVGDLMRMTG
ncbi:hypothetical protein [Actinoplanes flavus]|uniref:Uncharacterized protein n=1 Tax=Actinoplanes flavus TaxID=2820290 RepID=A0ABS3UUC6_9ACTN|nr:hypothetical protein [Actinoplanes flavus]MBO3742203.1 hypothetical protein [Actinoplanes flavus]